MKRSEILENRKKVIEFLKQPERLKHTGVLVNPNNHEARCCIGHMCEVLIPETKEIEGSTVTFSRELLYAPNVLIKKLGLHSCSGRIKNSHSINGLTVLSLTDLNDLTVLTTQEIGAYLELVIEGGEHTPWKHLNEYSEE